MTEGLDFLADWLQIAAEQEAANRSRAKMWALGVYSPPDNTCLLCNDAAVSVAYVPSGTVRVCAKHGWLYQKEGGKSWKDTDRPFRDSLERALIYHVRNNSQ